jgi:transposase
MDAREQRGLVIAACCKLNKQDGEWLVPSQSCSEKIYRVNPAKQTCTCPDHQDAGHKCKHLFAVEITIKREIGADGMVMETKTVTFTEKKTYPQNWPAYNAAQSVEKDRLQELLADLVRGIAEPAHDGRGRKPHGVRNSLFAMVFKVYSTVSSRRFNCDLRDAWHKGHISHSIPGRKVCEFFENEELTPILKELIVQSARPLRAVESQFAIDSSGFSTCKFERWYDEKYGVTRQKCQWVKCHIACGVKTNVVTAVRILDKDAADAPQFVPLVKETAKSFTIGEVSADKAYASLENFEAVASCGGTGYLAFKSNATGGVGGLFEKMFHYFQFKQDEYMEHYHKRSNVESTFSAVKRKFGDSVRSKTDTAMVNEVLCKFICQNLTCLIMEQHELGIEPIFWKNENCGQTTPLALTDRAVTKFDDVSRNSACL